MVLGGAQNAGGTDGVRSFAPGAKCAIMSGSDENDRRFATMALGYVLDDEPQTDHLPQSIPEAQRKPGMWKSVVLQSVIRGYADTGFQVDEVFPEFDDDDADNAGRVFNKEERKMSTLQRMTQRDDDDTVHGVLIWWEFVRTRSGMGKKVKNKAGSGKRRRLN